MTPLAAAKLEAAWPREHQSLSYFLACTKTQTYWDQVVWVLEDILGYKIPKDPCIVYLSLFKINVKQTEDVYLDILIIAVKKDITRKWLNSDSPGLTGHKMTDHLRTKALYFEQYRRNGSIT